MRRFRLLSSVVVVACFFHGAARALEVDQGVPAEQARIIEHDLRLLDQIQYQDTEADRGTAALLKIEGRLSGQALLGWLNQRVSTIVSETLNLQNAVLVAPARAFYPEAESLPALEKPAPSTNGGAQPPAAENLPKIVMANVGAALYLFGKQNQLLLALKKTDGSLLPLVSPQGGVIQIGEGLFYRKFQIDPEHAEAQANSISRLSTFFHEARHSDGHGRTLGFAHAICPEGHPYAGYPACDKNLNGPYTVGAQILKTLAQGCGDCSIREKAILKAHEADSRSRILHRFKDAQGKEQKAGIWSDRPERIERVVEKTMARAE